METEVLVTGGSGLLGYALQKVLPDAAFVSTSDYDLTDICQTRNLFEELRPKRVIHLAARVGGVKSNRTKNADFVTLNLQINANVLSAAREYGVKRLVSLLSSCALAFYPDRPSTEDDLHVGAPFEGNLGYGYAKRMLDVQTKLLAKQYGCSFSTVTPVTLYGPNDNWDIEDGHVISALIHKCVLAKEKRQPLEVWGSGNALRQFAYSNDLARLLREALDLDWGPETVIVVADNGLTIRDLTRKVAEAVGFDGPVVFNTNQPEGQMIKVVKSKKFAGVFPHFVFTPLEEGLKETVKWFLDSRKVLARR